MSSVYRNSQHPENVPPTLVDRIYYQKGKPDLDLSLCTLQRVPLDAIRSHYGEVFSLDMSYNYIRCLPPNFVSKLRTLTKLNLSRNELKRLPDNFGLLEQLVYFYVQKNQLQTLPLSMGKMRQLQYLNIAENPFRPPFCNFLDAELHRVNREPSGIEAALMVIKYLSKLSREIFASGDYRPGSQRVITFESDEGVEEEETLNINDENNRKNKMAGRKRNKVTKSQELQDLVHQGESMASRSSRQWLETSISKTDHGIKGMSATQRNTMAILLMLGWIFVMIPLFFAFFYRTPFMRWLKVC